MNPYDQETTRGQVRPPGGGRPEEKPFLLGIAGEHAGRLFPLEGLRDVYIGRGPDCEVSCVLDHGVSRRHAHVALDETGRAWIEDLGSLNGTLVNGADVARSTVLRRGDRIFLGENCILKLDWLTAEEVARWHAATVDALTECLNRASFRARLTDLLALGRGRDVLLSLLMLDVDRFKSVNDEYGHLVGDYVLQRTAAAVKAVLAEIPGQLPAYRCGGEEFAVLLPETGADDARTVAENIRERVATTAIAYQDLRLSVTVSIGVATAAVESLREPEDLIREADERLYRAKREGRNRVIG